MAPRGTPLPLFRTPVTPVPLPHPIGLGETILMTGSCFCESMGEKLSVFLFDPCVNYSGVLYNPSSILASLRRLDSALPCTSSDLFFHEGLWKSLDHHGRFDATSPRSALRKINSSLRRARDVWQRCTTLIVTFGTAWVWRHRPTGAVVANCHRIPPSEFKRELLSPDEIVGSWREFLAATHARRPDLKVILTVSPVRYLRDDPADNSIGKAHLLTAVHALCRECAGVFSFPSWEIMMDELRDYRFYGDDMVHPSQQTIDYIWNRFVESCLDAHAREFVAAWLPVATARAHRARSRDGVASFAASMLSRIDEIQSRFCIDAGDVRRHFESLAGAARR